MIAYSAMVRALLEAEARFVVIGGVAGVLHGSPRFTNDLDLCYDPAPDNVARLLETIGRWEPYPRGWPPGLPFAFDARTFATTPILTLQTRLGDLDLLDRVEPIGDFASVREQAVDIPVFGSALPTLDLPALVRVKRHVGRPKDREALHELEVLLALRVSEEGSGGATE